jgi:carbon storage regulator
MLVLTRKVNESIVIDSNVEVSILRMHKNKVILGFSAPRGVSILRGELQPQDHVEMEILLETASS